MKSSSSHPHRKSPLLPRDQLIMGIHAVREILIHAPDRLIRVYSNEHPKQQRKSELLNLCNANGIPFAFTSNDELKRMVGSDSHQSIVAHIQRRPFIEVKEFLKKIDQKEHALVLMIDQIFDPQNFGALIRNAECLGVDAIVWSKNRGTELTPVVAKSSCGASEFLPLIRISNLAEAVGQFQKEGFQAVATLINEKSQNAFFFRFNARTLLILGSEGEGIQPLICKRADDSIYIPMKGRIGSLNVAQAGALLMGLYQKEFIKSS